MPSSRPRSHAPTLNLRQRLRRSVLLVSLLLFPATLYYFSPVLVVEGAAHGIVNGSALVFGSLFLASLFLGRLWCGWACPANALQDLVEPIRNQPVTRGQWVKWALWIPWIGLILVLAVRAGGYRTVDPFYQMEGGLTFLNTGGDGGAPPWYFIYYLILFLFAGLALLFGRRAACHTICWMAPFMILGQKVRDLFRWPALRLVADPSRCADCRTCSRNCPMSLDVNDMVRRGRMDHADCTLCGTCVDGCSKNAIAYAFGSPRSGRTPSRP